jgi:hypothetical protein
MPTMPNLNLDAARATGDLAVPTMPDFDLNAAREAEDLTAMED